MKQLLSLFLFLLPCFAWAQYPSNGNQKITLGEQTTADGLIWRGVAATDTTRKPSIDTMAYMVLDTTTNIMWHYKKATSNAWLRVGGSITSGLTGTLPVANGGTGASSFSPNNYLIRTNSSGIFDTANIYEANGNIGVGTASAGVRLTTKTQTNSNNPTLGSGTIGGQALLSSDGLYGQYSGVSNTGNVWHQVQRNDGSTDVYNMIFQPNGGKVGIGTMSPATTLDVQTASNKHILFSNANGQPEILATTDGGAAYVPLYFSGSVFCLNPTNASNVGIGTTDPTQILHVVGNGRFTAVGAGAYSNDLNITSTGVLTTASSSDETFKYNINPITYGLSTILQLKPVSFQWKKGDEHDLGFIAQDAVNIIPEAVDTFWDSSLLFRSNTIIPILTKAMQEQQALIKALEQRIINLENK
jgi:hypothetical protein